MKGSSVSWSVSFAPGTSEFICRFIKYLHYDIRVNFTTNTHVVYRIRHGSFEDYQHAMRTHLAKVKVGLVNRLEKFGNRDDVIKSKHFPRYWPFVRGIHRSPVDSPHKDHARGALLFSLICDWTNGWTNNRDAGDWRRHLAHYDVILMCILLTTPFERLCPEMCLWNLKGIWKKNHVSYYPKPLH